MVKQPKRRKTKDNPYVIERINGVNFVSFKDANGVLQIVEVNKDVFEIFNESELRDISQMHEYERHIEHSEIFENNLYKRSIDKAISVEDEIMKKTAFEDLKNAINTLPEIQQRRIKKYYFDDMTFEEIAKEENCTKRAVKFSVDIALEKISKILKK